MKAVMQHIFNSGHIYCRLRSIGFGKKITLLFCQIYDPIISRLLYNSVSERKSIK